MNEMNKGVLMDFLKIFLVRGRSKWVVSDPNTGFLKILYNERGPEAHEHYINSFSEKILFRTNGPFWARKWRTLITLDRL